MSTTSDFTLILDDVRRLTGANLFSQNPGAVIDVTLTNISADSVIGVWQQQYEKVAKHLNWLVYPVHIRCYSFDGIANKADCGISIMLEGPIDELYSRCDLLESVWRLTCAEFGQLMVTSFEQELQPELDFDSALAHLQQVISDERSPQLIALQARSEQLQCPFLWDDDQVSIGHGKTAQVFDADNLPAIEQIDWQNARTIPCAYVTGTNGKSTSVRLAAKIAASAGLSAGITSTDFIRVGEQILDYGDYSGPGGARILLRNPQTEIAFLEVARGGLLRRGLPVSQVNAALITNVAADHLGDYGINTVEDMTEAKFIVAKGLSNEGILVLNADDENIVNYFVKHRDRIHQNIFWFSLNAQNSTLIEHIKCAGTAIYLQNGELFFASGAQIESVIKVNDIPMSMQGAARHNIQNAMGVIGLCKAMNIETQFIFDGLMNFHSDQKDNPGRGNCFEYHGAQVFIDFAHNAHSVNAIVSTLQNLPAKRKLVLLCQAGDRSNEDIAQLTQQILALNPDHFIICELEHYLRGRAIGEVPQVFYQQLKNNGIDKERIEFATSPLAGANKALQWASSGDLLLLLALSERDEIFSLLSSS